MPGSTVRVERSIGRLCKRSVGPTPVVRAGCAVDGRADQRMTEDHSCAQLQQAFRFGRVSSQPPVIVLGWIVANFVMAFLLLSCNFRRPRVIPRVETAPWW